MEIELVGLLLAAVALPGWGQSGPATVDVYMNGRDESFRLLGSRKPLASEIFKKIGVHLNWHTGELPAGQRAFGIRTVKRAPHSASPGALAASQLSNAAAVEITMYRDRLHLFFNAYSTPVGSDGASIERRTVLAAYTLAHELGHAIQGIARHSETGILKAYWSDSDFKDMMFHTLTFTPYDIELIHRRLTAPMAGKFLEADESCVIRK